MRVGFGPEVDFGVVVVGATGEDEAVFDFLQIEGAEEAGRGEFFAVGEDVLVETMMPIRIGEKRFELSGHAVRLEAHRSMAIIASEIAGRSAELNEDTAESLRGGYRRVKAEDQGVYGSSIVDPRNKFGGIVPGI